MNIDELWDKYKTEWSISGFDMVAITKERFTQAIAEIISQPLEAEVMPNEVVGGGNIYQLNEDNKGLLYKKFASKGLNLIVASHNQALQYAKLEDGRNADYNDYLAEVNGKLIFLKEYDSRREA